MRTVSPMAIAVLALGCFITGAAAASCVEAVTDYASSSLCAKSEIEPLNMRLDLLNAAVAKRVAGTEAALSFDLSKRSWLAYYNAQCTLEATELVQSGAKLNSPGVWQSQLKCAKRILEARIKELEGK